MNGYFDNGSTSFPKPPEVGEAIHAFIDQMGGTYGRGATQRIRQSTAMVEKCRDHLARRIGLAVPEHLFFTSNATSAANTLLMGLGLSGEVWVSGLEHNAVMRPLYALQQKNKIRIRVLPSGKDGRIDCEVVKQLSQAEVSLVVINHQSNVNGVIQPIAQLKELCSALPVMVDATQSLGYIPVEVDKWKIDFLFFTGHKGLLGPTGTGGFFARRPDELSPLLYGGTGSWAESYEMPPFYPERFEAGTPNLAGISGLLAAMEHSPKQGYTHADLIDWMDRLEKINGIQLLRASDSRYQGALFSLVHDQLPIDRIAYLLEVEYGIETRSGLHCAPLAHRTLDTFPTGTLRISLSPYHTKADMELFYASLAAICKEADE